MAKITRKQLKKDRFAEEVRHSVSYVSTHRNSMIAAAAALVVITGGIYGYVTYRRAAELRSLRGAGYLARILTKTWGSARRA